MKTTANAHPVLSFWQAKGSSTAGGPCATVFFDPNKTKVWRCAGCGRLYEASALDSGRVHAEGASAKVWPDFLFGFELIVSERRQFPVNYRPGDWFMRIERKVRAAHVANLRLDKPANRYERKAEQPH
jgi:hypothetical protein